MYTCDESRYNNSENVYVIMSRYHRIEIDDNLKAVSHSLGRRAAGTAAAENFRNRRRFNGERSASILRTVTSRQTSIT